MDGALGRSSGAEKNFPRICIWESDGEAGDITYDIIDTLEVYKDPSTFDYDVPAVQRRRISVKKSSPLRVSDSFPPRSLLSVAFHCPLSLWLSPPLSALYLLEQILR